MAQRYIRTSVLMLVCAIASGVANAQSFDNVGELVTKGGKRVDGVALKALLSGATISGNPMRGRGTVEVTYNADGSARGILYGRSDLNFPFSGTWMVNDRGELCTDYRSSGGTAICTPYYSMNNNYYQAESEERGAAVELRSIKR